MKYKMLVIDMDDTLLTTIQFRKKIKKCFFKAQEKGLCYFGIGRPTPAMIAYAKELKLDNCI
jgi:hydroxymethylpyrimidine pyrophosphatase-like HAD family hydrolase